MSDYSSVRTSRVQSVAAKSIISAGGFSSRMSRVSSKISSVPSSKIASALSAATSHLTEMLSSKMIIDEYGFTNKSCRSCGNMLSIEEVIALSIPLDANGNPLCKVEDINFDEMSLICLSCYAEIVSSKNKAREKVMEAIKETPLKPARVVSSKHQGKGEAGGEVKNSEVPKTSSSKRSVSSNVAHASNAYRKVARPVMPFASDPTKFLENIRKDKYNRRKTDLTKFANATFTGGVFVNGFHGESI